MRACIGVCECVCVWQISIHVYQTVDVFDLLPRPNCLMVEGQGYILHVCACVYGCVKMLIYGIVVIQVTIQGKILVAGK